MKLFIFQIFFLFHLISSGICIYTNVNEAINELTINDIYLNGTDLFSILFNGPDGCEISMKINFSDFPKNQRFYGNNNCASLQLTKAIKRYYKNSSKLIFNELKFAPEQQFEITIYDQRNVLFYNSSFITPSNLPSIVRKMKVLIKEHDLILSWDRPSRVGGDILEYRVIYYNGSRYTNYTKLICSTNCGNYTKIGSKYKPSVNGDPYTNYGTLLDQFTQEFNGNQKSFQFTINKSVLLSSACQILIHAVNEWGYGYEMHWTYRPQCFTYSEVTKFLPTTISSTTIKTSPTTISSTTIKTSPTAISSTTIKTSPTTISSTTIKISPTTISSTTIKTSPTTKSSTPIKTSPTTISSTSSTQIPKLPETLATLQVKEKYSSISNVPDQVNVTLDLVVQEVRGEEQKKKLTRPQQYLVMLNDKRDSTNQCILWTIICGCQTQSSMTGENSDASTRHETSTNRMQGGCNQSKILMLQSSSTQYNYCHPLPQLSTTVILNSKASVPVSMEIRSQIYNGFTYSKENTQIFNVASIH